jgi:hypothetical protein
MQNPVQHPARILILSSTDLAQFLDILDFRILSDGYTPKWETYSVTCCGCDGAVKHEIVLLFTGSGSNPPGVENYK